MTITIRPANVRDAAAIARLRIESWRATYRGLVPDAYLAQMDADESIAMWERVLTAGPSTASVFVAESDGEVIGFAAGNMLREPRFDLDAELSAVYVRSAFQRKGIGRRLVREVTRAQRAHGAHGLVAWVIAGNKLGRGFFERLDGELLVEQPFQWDDMDLIEAAYGFHDIDALVAACGTLPAVPSTLH
ncbi:MAG TPA: GNAT family N-acetyltransferase [Casimicrobiaceae bacterium]|nr:GNAT family N-acetyltransferase [Casimicrobiaceae bacterium]